VDDGVDLMALHQMAARHAVPGTSFYAGHLYDSRCSFCDSRVSHVLGLALVDVAVAALDVVEGTGVEMDDPRLDYIVAQVDKGDLDRLVTALDALRSAQLGPLSRP